MNETLDIYDHVLVQITQSGWAVLKERLGKDANKIVRAKSAEYGWTRFSIFELMLFFGGQNFGGAEPPFENTIRLESRS